MALESNRVPQELKDSASWPEPMQREWGDDQGTGAAGLHRERLVTAFRKVRDILLDFHPDFLLMLGDDQYENFREDGIPPFCIYIFDQSQYVPLSRLEGFSGTKENFWGEPPDKVFTVRGHAQGAKHLTRRLMEEGFDSSYAYTFRSPQGLAHSFSQTLLYLDYDRQGLDIPLVPCHVNCYGSRVIRSRGGTSHLTSGDGEPDPPAPSPKRCFALGQTLARVLRESPWRVALMASSSWSHAFLTEKNHWLYPDMEADRQRVQELRSNRYRRWRNLSSSQIEESGQHEILNWVCLAGAMAELNRKAEIIDYVESYIFNSNKCFAVFRP